MLTSPILPGIGQLVEPVWRNVQGFRRVAVNAWRSERGKVAGGRRWKVQGNAGSARGRSVRACQKKWHKGDRSGNEVRPVG